MILELNDNNFQDEIESHGRMLIDFSAPWCSPCRTMEHIIEEIADEWFDKVKIRKVNIDENSDLLSQYKIRSIPTILLFKNGEVVDRLVGSQSKEKLVSAIEEKLATE